MTKKKFKQGLFFIPHMHKGKSVSVVFPAFNEQEGIGAAVREFFATGIVDEIVVVDNNSKDNTSNKATEAGARVVLEKRQGYGWASRRALHEAKGDIIIIAEPDGTFAGKDIFKLLAYAQDFDIIFGTRTSKESIWDGANMNLFLRYGNVFVAKLMEYLFNGPCLTDVGCTMKLFRREAIERIKPKFTVGGSHFSPELMILAITSKAKCIEIPLNYRKRVGASKITGDLSKAIRLGFVMIGLILAYRLGFKKAAGK